MDLARRLGISVDVTAVESALASLLTGGLYKSSDDTKTPNWGSTAIAVRTLRTLGLELPLRVRDNAVNELAKPRPGLSAQVVVDKFVPLLEIAAELGDASQLRSTVSTLYNDLLVALAAAAFDVVVLAATQALIRAGARLRLPVRDHDDRSCDLVNVDGGVYLPGTETVDLQGTYLAIDLGCTRARPPPPQPYSRTGWPQDANVLDALGPTAAAVRIAVFIDRLEQYAKGVSATLLADWLPRLVQPSPIAGVDPIDDVKDRLTTFARVTDIASLLGTQLPEVTLAPPIDADSTLAYVFGLSNLPRSSSRDETEPFPTS